MKKNILITGAAGYAGSLLTQALLSQGHRVVAFDTFWFGDCLQEHENLVIVKDNLTSFDFSEILKTTDTVVHLACLSNDPSYELNVEFSRQVNFEGSLNLIRACRNSPIKRFIFASSSSVYGVKKEENVTEELRPEPITPYSYYKLKVEEELAVAAKGQFDFVILRPATLCGPSPRLRLDVIGNILCAQAFFERKLIIHGGQQYRPQLNIKDMIRTYILCIEDEKDFHGEIYNIGEKNYTVLELGELARQYCPFSVSIEILPVIDNRSYRLNSKKIQTERGYKLAHSIDEAMNEMFTFFSMHPLTWTDPAYHNIKTMKALFSK